MLLSLLVLSHVIGCVVDSPMRPIFMPDRARALSADWAPGPGVLVLKPNRVLVRSTKNRKLIQTGIQTDRCACCTCYPLWPSAWCAALWFPALCSAERRPEPPTWRRTETTHLCPPSPSYRRSHGRLFPWKRENQSVTRYTNVLFIYWCIKQTNIKWCYILQFPWCSGWGL